MRHVRHAATVLGSAALAAGLGWLARPAAGAPASGATAALSAPATLTSEGSAEQDVTVRILGGSLTASPGVLDVTIHRLGRGTEFAGAYGPIRVVDARGTLAGWSASLAVVSAVAPGRLTVRPSQPIVISGVPGEAVRARPAALGTAGVPVMAAPPGGGGGTFADSGTVTLTGGPKGGPDSIDIAVRVLVD